jgi:hypothetical protein
LTSSSTYILKDFYISSYTNNEYITNVQITINKNSLRVSGHVEKNGQSGHHDLSIRTPNILNRNTIYTLGMSYINNLNDNNIRLNVDSSSSNFNVYVTDNVRIGEHTASSGYAIKFWVNDHSDFDVTIFNCFIYEGEFKNPPYHSSLDNNAVNFLNLNNLNFYNSLDRYCVPVQVCRTWSTQSSDTGMPTSFSVKLSRLRTTKTSLGMTLIYVAYLTEVPGTQYVGNRFRRYLIKCFARNYSQHMEIACETITEQTEYAMAWNDNLYPDRKINYSLSHTIETEGDYLTTTFILTGTTSGKMPNTVSFILTPIVVFDDREYTSNAFPGYYENPVVWS